MSRPVPYSLDDPRWIQWQWDIERLWGWMETLERAPTDDRVRAWLPSGWGFERGHSHQPGNASYHYTSLQPPALHIELIRIDDGTCFLAIESPGVRFWRQDLGRPEQWLIPHRFLGTKDASDVMETIRDAIHRAVEILDAAGRAAGELPRPEVEFARARAAAATIDAVWGRQG